MITKLGQSNQKIKDLRELFKVNKTKNLIVSDDLTVIKTAINNNNNILEFYYCDDVIYHHETVDLINKCIEYAKETFAITKSIFSKLALKDNSVELIVIIQLDLKTLGEMLQYNYLVVTDHLEIPGNLGTIYRSLDSANVEGLINVDTITKLTNSKLASSARGANLLIPTCEVTYAEALKFLKDNSYTIYLGEPNLGKDYQSYPYTGKIAIVVGNERFGINEDWYNHPHEKVFIPMFGSNNSLNVGVAASILIYEATMKRKKSL